MYDQASNQERAQIKRVSSEEPTSIPKGGSGGRGKTTNSPGDAFSEMASREIFEALGKRNDSIEQLRQEKYKPLQNPIEEEKTEDNLTIENEDNYGGASHTGKKMDGLNSRAKLGQKLRSLEDGYSSSQEGSKKDLKDKNRSHKKS
jgi:hypothetical protein